MFVEFHAAMKAIALLKSHNLHNTKHNIILKILLQVYISLWILLIININ